MSYDPLTQVTDAALKIDPAALDGLAAFRDAPKLVLLPGIDTTAERERLSKILNDLADTLLLGVRANPSKLWVMRQFQPALDLVVKEDTEAREHFGMELEQLMDVLHIDSSDGLLTFYLGGI